MLIKNEYKPQMLSGTTKTKKPLTSNGRIGLVLGAVALAFTGLLVRGVYLQTSQHEFLKNQGDQRFCAHTSAACITRYDYRPQWCYIGFERTYRIIVCHAFRYGGNAD